MSQKQKPRITFLGDGSSRSFNFTFPIFSENDISVFLDGELQTEGFFVSLSANADGGTVVFSLAPGNEVLITIARTLEIKRTTDFGESKAFRSKMLNHEFDYQIACLEQLADESSRAISFPIYSPNELNTAFPVPKAGKAIIWNEEGNALKNSEIEIENLISEINQVNNACQTAVNAANTAAAAADEISALINGVDSGITELSNQIEQKAEKNLSNVSTESVKEKAGNRCWISDDYAIASSVRIIVSHNLNLSRPEHAKAEALLICTVANNGYSVGDIITRWTWSDNTNFPAPGTQCDITPNTVETVGPRTGSAYPRHKTGAADATASISNFKIRFKIWY